MKVNTLIDTLKRYPAGLDVEVINNYASLYAGEFKIEEVYSAGEAEEGTLRIQIELGK